MLEPCRVRFEHKFLAEIGKHVLTSPDIKGFHITGSTREEAERDALAMLSLLRDKGLLPASGIGRLAAVEYEAA